MGHPIIGLGREKKERDEWIAGTLLFVRRGPVVKFEETA
jgi:hypothetical protein